MRSFTLNSLIARLIDFFFFNENFFLKFHEISSNYTGSVTKNVTTNTMPEKCPLLLENSKDIVIEYKSVTRPQLCTSLVKRSNAASTLCTH